MIRNKDGLQYMLALILEIKSIIFLVFIQILALNVIIQLSKLETTKI